MAHLGAARQTHRSEGSEPCLQVSAHFPREVRPACDRRCPSGLVGRLWSWGWSRPSPASLS